MVCVVLERTWLRGEKSVVFAADPMEWMLNRRFFFYSIPRPANSAIHAEVFKTPTWLYKKSLLKRSPPFYTWIGQVSSVALSSFNPPDDWLWLWADTYHCACMCRWYKKKCVWRVVNSSIRLLYIKGLFSDNISTMSQAEWDHPAGLVKWTTLPMIEKTFLFIKTWR